MIYRRIFGSGPTGILVTVFVWLLALHLEVWLEIPRIGMGVTFRWVLFWFFAIDATTMVIWSQIILPPHKRGLKLVTKGPFQFVRHPLYSVVIWSGTGMVAMWFQSWLVLVSVIPISVFWSWHVQREERYMLEEFGDEYREYMERTGQFFPRLK